MNTFYRLVNPCFEKAGNTYNTSGEVLSPRKKRTLELSSLFSIVYSFWQRTGVQLSTAMDAMLKFQVYLAYVQDLESKGEEHVPTYIFNNHEKLQCIPLQELKILMFAYYDLYNEKESMLEIYDLPFIWEYLWETVRYSFYPNSICRHLSLFLYDNKVQAVNLQKNIDPNGINKIVKVIVKDDGRLEKYDAGWLDRLSVDCTFNEYIEYCKNYWEGKESNQPNWEYLYSGQYSIVSD